MDERAPDITVDRINQILKTVFELLWFEPQGLYVSEIIRYMKESIVFTEYELGSYTYAPDFPRYEAIIRIGTIPFEKVGWLEKTKNGRWFITNEGRKACLAYKDSDKFFEVSAFIFNKWKAKESHRLALIETDSYFDATETSWEQINRYFQVLDINDLKILVTSLLKVLNCHINWTGSITTKESLEMLCSTDPLGIKSPSLHICITKKTKKTSIEDVKMYLQGLETNSIGVYFSFGGFEEGVKEFALNHQNPMIRLIDLERFVELWVENIAKVDKEGFSLFPLRPIHFLAISGVNRFRSIERVG